MMTDWVRGEAEQHCSVNKVTLGHWSIIIYRCSRCGQVLPEARK